MGSMKDLLPDGIYGGSAGFKKPGTSEEAASKIVSRSENMRARIVAALKVHGPMTTDETARKLGETVLATRPRFSELLKMNRIEETSDRRPNTSGVSAAVWRAKP